MYLHPFEQTHSHTHSNTWYTYERIPTAKIFAHASVLSKKIYYNFSFNSQFSFFFSLDVDFIAKEGNSFCTPIASL